MKAVPEDYEFALCLTHDIDRPYKDIQALYHAIKDRSAHHLRALLPGHQPWWQFDRLVETEARLDVTSAFYFLQEQHLLYDRSPREWFVPSYWIEHVGRYEFSDAAIASAITSLDEGGWEIGLHGSLGTHRDAEQLQAEKERLEAVVGHDVRGVRQHWLRIDPPGTWRIQRSLGLSYDASYDSCDRSGFQDGYRPVRPFDDDFLVFPLTVMDKRLEENTESPTDAWHRCKSLLNEARRNDAVMTVLWHLRNFCEGDYPGYAALYRDIIEEALAMGAWVGPPGTLYEHIVDDGTEVPSTTRY